MDATSLLIGLLAGLLIGSAIVFLVLRGRSADLLRNLRDERDRDRKDHEARVRELSTERERERERVTELSGLLSAEQERNRGLTQRLEQQKDELEALQKRMTTEFENIANRLLTQRGKELNDQQQEKLGTLLKPLHERIREFELQVREAYEKEGRERFALKKEVALLVEQNQRLSEEADNLTRALKGDSQAQGAWGEMILERLLEDAGLVKGVEYTLQESTTGADGGRLRPDAVVKLPDDKHLIIDSKVSLVHYERHTASTDPAERDRLLKQHVESLRTHAKGLGQKEYTKIHGIGSVDFVLMFVPIEPAFLLALRERPEIFQEAYDRGVVMVTHSTLMATLRMVHGLWKNERIAQNHMKIADRAGKLYDKFVGFSEDLGRIGKLVKDAQQSYEQALGKLSDGPGSLVRQVEMLKELGAKTNKTIHPKLLERAGEAQDDPAS